MSNIKYLCKLSYEGKGSFFLGPNHVVSVSGNMLSLQYAWHDTHESIIAALTKYPYAVETYEVFECDLDTVTAFIYTDVKSIQNE